MSEDSIEQRIANLEDAVKLIDAFVSQLADIVAENLQEPKVDATTEDRVVIEGLFRFRGEITMLSLPDDSMLWLPPGGSTWVKAGNHMDISSHTLINVDKHTVGKFYLYENGNPNEFVSYGLCLGEGEFASAYLANGFIGVSKYNNTHITLQEVTPL